MKKQIIPAVLFFIFFTFFTCSLHAQWSITGNAGTTGATNFIGTTDNVGFKIRTNNIVRITVASTGKVGIGTTTPAFKLDVKNGSINTDSVYRIAGRTVLSVIGFENCFLGTNTGYFNTTGSFNTATGAGALRYNIDGYENVGNGANALYNNSSGDQNIAIGCGALQNNTTGGYNTATGHIALYSNTTANFNTANGYQSLFNNTTGEKNSASGTQALLENTTGYFNTAGGYASLNKNTTGFNNSAHGVSALYFNTTGSHNTANGMYSLYNNTNSSYNTAFGYQSLYNNVTGQFNTAIGYNTGANNGYNLSNATAIGYSAGHVDNATNEIEIGNTSVAWIAGQVGWSSWSDQRIKDNIQSNVPGLAFITRLNPVTYNLNIHRQNEMCGINDTHDWEGKYDIEKITQTGFLAQEVELAAKENNFDFNGVRAPTGNIKLYSIQYAAFVVPLVKAVQELNEEVIRLKAQDIKHQDRIEALKSEIENLKSILPEEQQQKLKALRDGNASNREDEQALLFQNSPNPSTGNTTIRFSVPASSQHGEIKIYAAGGKEIQSFSIAEKGAGQIEFNTGSLAAGMYDYTLFIDGRVAASRQLVLMKR